MLCFYHQYSISASNCLVSSEKIRRQRAAERLVLAKMPFCFDELLSLFRLITAILSKNGWDLKSKQGF